MAKLPALPYVRAGLSQGLSANAAYRQYVDLAHENDLTGTRRQDFLRLYSQTARLRAQAEGAIDLPKDQVPGDTDIIDRDTVNARGYGQWVAIFQRSRAASDFISTPFLVKSPQPLSPQEAENRAIDYLNTQPDEYDRVTLGVTYTGTERFQPTATL